MAPARRRLWPVPPYKSDIFFSTLPPRRGSVSALDAVETRRDAALKKRPVEAERQRQIAALDHLSGLLGRARHATDRDAALQDAGFGARHQCEDFGIIGAAALVDAGCEVARTDHRDVDAGCRHDLVDLVDPIS